MSAEPEAPALAVTVLLPVRDELASLAPAVRSVLGQDFTALELLVLEDGAGPAVQGAVAEIAAADARVRVLRQEAPDRVAALNLGLEAAAGPFVALMTADAVVAPERLSRQVGLLTVAPEVAFIGAGWRLVAGDGRERRVVRPPASDAALRPALAAESLLAAGTVTMRREAALKAGGFRPAFAGAEVFDLLLRLMSRHLGAAIPDVLLTQAEPEDGPAWREMEQQMLAEIGAMAAHDRRQVGRPDHGEGTSKLDRTVLYRMGVAAPEVERVLLERALQAAAAAKEAGRKRALRQAARLGLQLAGTDGKLRRHFALLWAQAALPFG